jgi:hypothetical protein
MGDNDALMQSIDKSLNSSIERAGSPRRVAVRSPRVPRMASAPGLFRIRSKSCIPAAFGIENSVLHPRLDNIGATLEHHEAILHSHIFLIIGIVAFARGESVLARVTSYWAGEGS